MREWLEDGKYGFWATIIFFGIYFIVHVVFFTPSKIYWDQVGNMNTQSNQIVRLKFQLSENKTNTDQKDYSHHVSQEMNNSPNGTQIGGNLNAESVNLIGKRVIETMEIKFTIELDGATNGINDQWVNMGDGIVLVLLDEQTNRIRFAAYDRDIQFMTTPTQRVLTFTCKPVNPEDILGREIDYLEKMEGLGIFTSGIVKQTMDKWVSETTSGKSTISVTINGVMSASDEERIFPMRNVFDDKKGLAAHVFFKSAAANYKRSILDKTMPLK